MSTFADDSQNLRSASRGAVSNLNRATWSQFRRSATWMSRSIRAGNVYVVNGGGLPPPREPSRIQLHRHRPRPDRRRPAYAVAVDPADDHVYVDEGNRSPSSTPPANRSARRFGAQTASISNSLGVAARLRQPSRSANRGAYKRCLLRTRGSCPPTSASTTPSSSTASAPPAPATPPTSRSAPGRRRRLHLDLPLTGYDSAAHPEVFRYDALSDTLDCASCNPTGEQATGDATPRRRTASASPTTGASSSTRPKAWSTATSTQTRTPTSGRRRSRPARSAPAANRADAGADLHRHQPA